MSQKPDPQIPRRRFRFFRSVSALVLREMTTTYGRSPGGYLWAVVEPAAGIALLSFIFLLVVRVPAIGDNFPLFFATGLMPFLLFLQLSNLVGMAINYSRVFMAYPAVTFMDVILARFILNGLTILLVTVIVITGIIVVFDLTVILNGQAIMNAICMTFTLAMGVGVLNCYLFTAFPVWQRAWGILMRPMFILAGILFTPEFVPDRYLSYYMANPLPHITSEMRRGFYVTYDAVHVNSLYVYSVALVCGAFGMLLLLRNHKDLAEL
ncbi:MAG: ABC transporter permease [Pseudoprimorskyibacter sp.]|jgi:capsular polysaccharide transport system permease protein|nr:ABC transporter permease [Pseudoprimorskyibacter sp.]